MNFGAKTPIYLKAEANFKTKTILSQGAEAKTFIVEKDQKKYLLKEWKVKTEETSGNVHFSAMVQHIAAEHGFAPKVISYTDHSILMEYIEGLPLGDEIERFYANKVRDWARYLDIIKRTAFIIGELYDAGIPHYDLHPNNIIIESGTDKIFIIDFGLNVINNLYDGDGKIIKRGQLRNVENFEKIYYGSIYSAVRFETYFCIPTNVFFKVDGTAVERRGTPLPTDVHFINRLMFDAGPKYWPRYLLAILYSRDDLNMLDWGRLFSIVNDRCTKITLCIYYCLLKNGKMDSFWKETLRESLKHDIPPRIRVDMNAKHDVYNDNTDLETQRYKYSYWVLRRLEGEEEGPDVDLSSKTLLRDLEDTNVLGSLVQQKEDELRKL